MQVLGAGQATPNLQLAFSSLSIAIQLPHDLTKIQDY
jgi:hypothetical protein